MFNVIMNNFKKLFVIVAMTIAFVALSLNYIHEFKKEEMVIAYTDKKYEKALELAKSYLLKDDALSYFYIAEIYFNGYGVKKDEYKAKEYYYLAHKEIPLACYQLAKIHESNFDKNRAKWFYQHAVDNGISKAKYHLGKILLSGSVADQSVGIAWLKEAADNNDAEAMFLLGTVYKNGRGVSKNSATALSYFNKAAENGSPEAQYLISTFYFSGKGYPQDTKKGLLWCQKAAANGHSEAQYKLATLYADNITSEKDYSKAAYWYKKAAEQKHATAQYKLGMLYITGHGVPRDYSMAAQWFKGAVKERNSAACYELAKLSLRGKGIKKDIVKSIKLMEFAAKLGHSNAQKTLTALYDSNHIEDSLCKKTVQLYNDAIQKSTGEKLYTLAKYVDDRDLPRAALSEELWNIDKGLRAASNRQLFGQRRNKHASTGAFFWYSNAANKGHTVAQCCLGSFYHFGEVVDKNFDLAKYWYEKAARAENAEAQYLLASLSMERSVPIALKWYEKAVQNGHVQAAYELGIIFRNHKFVKADIPLSDKLLSIAAAGGHAKADLFLLGNLRFNNE